jgi:hypothetical protein
MSERRPKWMGRRPDSAAPTCHRRGALQGAASACIRHSPRRQARLDAPPQSGCNARPSIARSGFSASPIRGRVAQLVEQGIENPRVGGSIPSSATISFNDLRRAYRRPADGVCRRCVGFEIRLHANDPASAALRARHVITASNRTENPRAGVLDKRRVFDDAEVRVGTFCCTEST